MPDVQPGAHPRAGQPAPAQRLAPEDVASGVLLLVDLVRLLKRLLRASKR